MSRYSNRTPLIRDNNGKPIVNAYTHFYEPGTTTYKTIYSDSDFSTAIANPVRSLAGGILPTIFLDGVYKVVQNNENDAFLWPSEDPVGEVAAGQFDDWLNDKSYSFNDIVKGSDLAFYKSLVAGIETNQGNDPISSPTEWANAFILTSDVGRGALVYLSTTQSIATGVQTAVAFADESYDTDNIHDNATNNTRLTVPSGVTKVRLTADLLFENNATGERNATIEKNGSSGYIGGASSQELNPISGRLIGLNVSSPMLTVTSGDYFELTGGQSSGGNLNFEGTVTGDETWFGMEIIK